MQKLIERSGIDAHHRIFLRDQTFIGEIDRNPQRGLRRALAIASLQHPELALLDCEFHILHVTVMLLEQRVDARQFLERIRHCRFHGRFIGTGFLTRIFSDVLRRTDSRNHIFTLRIDQEFPVKLLFAGRGIACKGNAGSRRVTHVAEHHRLNIDSSAPGFRNVVEAAIGYGARVHPGGEHCTDGAP